MRPIATDLWCGVCVVCVRHEMAPCENGGPIEMPFGMWSGMGPSNHVLDGGLDPPGEMAILGWGRGRPIVKYRDCLLYTSDAADE